MRRLAEKNLRLEEANQELGQFNEELQAAHEESLVNSEEAQAAAEEVETLNEELQATNEELETLNEELQATVEELNTTNDDLQARATELQELAQSREEERQLTEAGRRRAEDLVEQLQSERSRLEAILVNISDAVLAVDAEGQLLFSNQVFEETFGEHDDGNGACLAPRRCSTRMARSCRRRRHRRCGPPGENRSPCGLPSRGRAVPCNASRQGPGPSKATT